MTPQVDDVYQLFVDRLRSVCIVHLAFDFNGMAFNSIELSDQAPGEDVCAAIARHMCDALTTHGTTDQ